MARPEGSDEQWVELAMLDAMAEFTKARRLAAPYHFIRAWAHEHGYHLTSCQGGKSIIEPEVAEMMEGKGPDDE